MKRIIFSLVAFFITGNGIAQIGIGTNSPNSKAILDLSSTDKGLLLPRMTAVQRLAINPAGAARGLMVFDTDSLAPMFWTGTAWQRITSGGGSSTGNFWALGGNALTGTEKLGSTNNKSLVLIGNGLHMIRFDTGRLGTLPLPRITGGSELNLISGGGANTILNGGQSEAQKNHIVSGSWNTIGNGTTNAVVRTNYGTILSGDENSIGFQESVEIRGYGVIAGGSSNIVKSSYGFIGMGDQNLVEDDYGFIGNGQQNIIKSGANYSFIGAGDSLVTVSGIRSFMGSGKGNSIAGVENNVLTGGYRNRITSGSANFLGGGENNVVSGLYSVIAGGRRDTVLGNLNGIVSGVNNRIQNNSTQSFIGSGAGNQILGSANAVISGGSGNTIQNSSGANIGGGNNNDITGALSTIGGGFNNDIRNGNGFIGGGRSNLIRADYAVLSGGDGNEIFSDADSAFIGGGGGNYVAAIARGAVVVGGRSNGAGNNYSVVVGGRENFAEGPRSFIGGGTSNRTIGTYGTIAGGWQNLVDEGLYSSILGGRANFALQGNYITIGGGYRNIVEDGSHFGTIAGGDSNRIQLDIINGSIGGGKSNALIGNAQYGSIGGGQLNKIEKRHSVIGGGLNNWSRGDYSTVSGGNTNEAGGDYSAVLGGAGNSAASEYASVIGGRNNNAWGKYGVAAGFRSNITHGSVFMFADERASGDYFDSKNSGQFMARILNGALFTNEDTSTIVRAQLHTRSGGNTPQLMVDQVNDDFARIRLRSAYAAVNQWDIAAKVSSGEFNIFRNGTGNVLQLTPTNATNLMMMSNGARLTAGGTWTNASDRNVKDNISPVDGNDILEKLSTMPVATWHYKNEADTVLHIGPMAQDFKSAFGLGDSDKSIATVDADGVNMAAIQALYKRLLALEKQNEDLLNEIKRIKADKK